VLKPFFFFNYAKAQSCLPLLVVTNFINENTTQRKKDRFVETMYLEVQNLLLFSFLLQLSENEEDKLSYCLRKLIGTSDS